jgi:hypothetical protein
MYEPPGSQADNPPGVVPGGAPLSNRRARSGNFGMHGRAAIGVGLLLLAVGAGTSVAGWRAASHGAGMALFMGALIAAMGAALVVHGVRDTRRLARVSRQREAHPNEPWRWDYQWDERGAVDDTMERARHFTTSGLVLLAFLAPAHLFAFSAFAGSPLGFALIPFALVALLFDAVALGLLAAGGYFALRRLKYGRGIALFESFPFRRGETLQLYVAAPSGLPQHAVVTATLRCVQERYVTRRKRDGEDDTRMECFEVCRYTGPAEPVDDGLGGRALRVTFPIPPDPPSTDLASRPCRYWEVDVEASTDGVDYGARFLVPIY